MSAQRPSGLKAGMARNGAQTYGRAGLEMIPPHRTSIVHCVEGRHLVHPHRRHLQQPRDLIHDADAREAVLSLSEVEQRHDRRLLVLARVPAEDFFDELFILHCELERY